jgi:hypothetical protein
MIAAPWLIVIGDHLSAGPADRSLPRDAIAFSVSDDQVWSRIQIRAAIELLRVVDCLNRFASVLIVTK